MSTTFAWLTWEFWGCGAWMGFALADQSGQPESVSLWLRATTGEGRTR